MTNLVQEEFQAIVHAITQSPRENLPFAIFDPIEQFHPEGTGRTTIFRTLNAAFLITLAGPNHPSSERAEKFLLRLASSSQWAKVANFYLSGKKRIVQEIEAACEEGSDFAHRLKTLSSWLPKRENLSKGEEITEHIWSLFFPEAASIRKDTERHINALRQKRIVTITEPNHAPITNPGREILFTSNVLLTIPAASTSLPELPLSKVLVEKIRQTSEESQLYWYDHPIQIGVEPERNEILYGLRGLETALEFEKGCGTVAAHTKLTCILSVSVTHRGLQEVARRYIEEELGRAGELKDIDVYVFTEPDTQRIVDEILVPAAENWLGLKGARELLSVFGVDGEYGRHYSFLKAIAPLWQILFDPEIRATFKIDLDQVFPQKELMEQTGATALQHFMTPLWGAHGFDSEGGPIELGMIAGALVNEKDIGKSLFTPDVLFPTRGLSPDEYIFFSTLPQALSTEAEMMTRYNTAELDGEKTCIQRIHVTGGTNGVLIDSLCRHRPFTPSFMGRAEDQAYILSVYPASGTKLAYVHKEGLVMRHDKEAFAQQAIQTAQVGKLLGDYVRILYFSTYARVLEENIAKLKDAFDPFTGCFISRIPTTVVYLRLALKAASFFAEGQEEQGIEFITNGADRITRALEFAAGQNPPFKQQFEKERLGWNLYYDTLAALEEALNKKDDFALELREKAEKIVGACHMGS